MERIPINSEFNGGGKKNEKKIYKFYGQRA